jgi:hypothetical protein
MTYISRSDANTNASVRNDEDVHSLLTIYKQVTYHNTWHEPQYLLRFPPIKSKKRLFFLMWLQRTMVFLSLLATGVRLRPVQGLAFLHKSTRRGTSTSLGAVGTVATSFDDGQSPFQITTPIYYVNDKPHIGHAYTSTGKIRQNTKTIRDMHVMVHGRLLTLFLYICF